MSDADQPAGYGFNLSPIVQAATAQHEMFLAYLAAGFTEDQAIKLISAIILSGLNAGGSGQ